MKGLKEIKQEIDSNFDILIDQLSNAYIEQSFSIQPDPLVSPVQKKLKLKNELTASLQLNKRKDAIRRGISQLQQHGIFLFNKKQSTQWEAFEIESEKKSEDAVDASIVDAFSGKLTVQKILGVEDQKMDEVYQLAKSFFENKHYGEARDLFDILLILDGFYADVWTACALSSLMLNDIERSFSESMMAIILNPKGVEPYFCLVECHIIRKEMEEAKKYLPIIETLLGSQASNEEKARFDHIRNSLSKKGE